MEVADALDDLPAIVETPSRQTVFISHANPEDNEFTAWLGTRLIGAGYQVWSDLLRLVGGEPFWRDIGDAIKDHAAVVILVLTRSSVIKPGVLDEIALAVATSRKLQNPRFIIPVRLDDLPFDEFPEQVIRLNAINFNGNWADGLHRLLEALDERAIDKVEGASAQGIAEFRDFPPAELFIHGKARFSDDEWAGFSSAVSAETQLVGVRIRPTSELKLFRLGKKPVQRGTAYLASDRLGYLWTKGFIPRLATYPGWEVPNPLLVEIHRGEADLKQVMGDILGLTKINFNACVFADGLPVTLKFADAVGDILTAAPVGDLPPLPFRHYI